MGDIQPIGGVNEKIEGFFDVCKSKGLTGKQGVIVPVQNAQHLMLRKDVVKAVAQNKFHIYTVNNVDEGIQILTGKGAGSAKKDGKYPPNTVHGMVMKRLVNMSHALNEFESKKEDNDDDKKTKGGKKIKKKAKNKKAKKVKSRH